jgi:nitrogen fixation protein FixH
VFIKKFGVFLICLAIALFIATGVFAQQSFDMYGAYSSLIKNTYVGGDAYNYIINGTYFAAFAVYAAACGISGFLTLIGGVILISLSITLKEVQVQQMEAVFRKNTTDNH